MASNTLYLPQSYPLDASRVQGAGQGIAAVCAANTTTNIDLTLSDDHIITGLKYLISGASLGDYLDLKVMLGAATVATPISNWYIAQTEQDQFDLVMPLKIAAGLKLRIVFHATALFVTPSVAVNYKLWKVLE